jgi:hypothetical protein
MVSLQICFGETFKGEFRFLGLALITSFGGDFALIVVSIPISPLFSGGAHFLSPYFFQLFMKKLRT